MHRYGYAITSAQVNDRNMTPNIVTKIPEALAHCVTRGPVRRAKSPGRLIRKPTRLDSVSRWRRELEAGRTACSQGNFVLRSLGTSCSTPCETFSGSDRRESSGRRLCGGLDSLDPRHAEAAAARHSVSGPASRVFGGVSSCILGTRMILGVDPRCPKARHEFRGVDRPVFRAHMVYEGRTKRCCERFGIGIEIPC